MKKISKVALSLALLSLGGYSSVSAAPTHFNPNICPAGLVCVKATPAVNAELLRLLAERGKFEIQFGGGFHLNLVGTGIKAPAPASVKIRTLNRSTGKWKPVKISTATRTFLRAHCPAGAYECTIGRLSTPTGAGTTIYSFK